jgi:hypothetical protein
LDNGQEHIKESFRILAEFLDHCGAKKYLDDLIFLKVHLPTDSEESDALRVTMAQPISEKVEKLIQAKNQHPNVSF